MGRMGSAVFFFEGREWRSIIFEGADMPCAVTGNEMRGGGGR